MINCSFASMKLKMLLSELNTPISPIPGNKLEHSTPGKSMFTVIVCCEKRTGETDIKSTRNVLYVRNRTKVSDSNRLEMNQNILDLT